MNQLAQTFGTHTTAHHVQETVTGLISGFDLSRHSDGRMPKMERRARRRNRNNRH